MPFNSESSKGLLRNFKKVTDGQSILSGQMKKFSYLSDELWIHQMDLLSCTISALSLIRELPGLELSRECLIVSYGQG